LILLYLSWNFLIKGMSHWIYHYRYCLYKILAKIPDSHISRKFGDKIAKKTINNAHDLLKILDREYDPDYLAKALNNLDYEYKKKGINPGTTADLLVASLMIYKIFRT